MENKKLKKRRYPNMSDLEYNVWKAKLSKVHKGKSQSKETIEKRIKSLKKVIHTKEWNDKVRKSKLMEKNPNWKGGFYKTNNGYIMIKVSEHPFSNTQGYIQEHRLKVEAKIGRYLTKEEKIHHLDENRINNNINNLMLFKNDSEHQKFHNKIKQFGFTNPILKQIEKRWEIEKPKKKTKFINIGV